MQPSLCSTAFRCGFTLFVQIEWDLDMKNRPYKDTPDSDLKAAQVCCIHSSTFQGCWFAMSIRCTAVLWHTEPACTAQRLVSVLDYVSPCCFCRFSSQWHAR